MDPVTASALIGAGSNAISSIVSNIGSKKAAKYAAKKNLEFWHTQNEYNHPTAQMQRLQEAGLNPNLIYGTSPTSAVGNAEKINPMEAPKYKFDNPLADIHKFQNLKQATAQTDNLRTQNTVLTNEAILKSAQARESIARGAKTWQDKQQSHDLFQTQLSVQKQNLRNLELDTISKELDNRFKDQGLKDRLHKIYYEAQTAKESLTGQKKLNRLRQLEIQLNQLGIQKGDNLLFRFLGQGVETLRRNSKEFGKWYKDKTGFNENGY